MIFFFLFMQCIIRFDLIYIMLKYYQVYGKIKGEKKIVLEEKYFLIFINILYVITQVRFNFLFCKFVFLLNRFFYFVDDIFINKRFYEYSFDCGSGFGGDCGYYCGSQYRNVEV